MKYRLHAGFEMTEKAGPGDNANKFAEMFTRRAAKGQCINQPYLGCREFACDFRLIEADAEAAGIPDELRGQQNLGWMLYDLDFSDTTAPQPRFFNARMVDGVVEIPAWDSEEVRG